MVGRPVRKTTTNRIRVKLIWYVIKQNLPNLTGRSQAWCLKLWCSSTQHRPNVDVLIDCAPEIAKGYTKDAYPTYRTIWKKSNSLLAFLALLSLRIIIPSTGEKSKQRLLMDLKRDTWKLEVQLSELVVSFLFKKKRRAVQFLLREGSHWDLLLTSKSKHD